MAHLGFISKLAAACAMLCAMSCAIAQNGSGRPEQERPKYVLVLNSYEAGYEWSDREMEGIRDVFRSDPAHYLASYEYMDSRKTDRKALAAALERLYAAKYRGAPIDVIIAADDFALEFALKRRRRLWPGVPIVFCGVNHTKGHNLEAVGNVTGVVEAVTIVPTMQFALRVVPYARTIVAVYDDSNPGREQRIELNMCVGKTVGGARVVHYDLSERTLRQAELDMARLPRDHVVLLLADYRDSTGHLFGPEDGTARLAKASSVPSFVTTEGRMGYGVLGGVLSSGYDQGSTAARMAVQVLHGTPPSAIPIATAGTERTVVDYRALKRFGITATKLPPDAVLMNAPEATVRVPMLVYWVVRAALVVLAGMLLAMVVQLSVARARRKEHAASEARLLAAQRIGRLGSWAADPASDAVTCSAMLCELLEIPLHMSPTSWLDLLGRLGAARTEVETCVRDAVERASPAEADVSLSLPSGRVLHAALVVALERAGPGSGMRIVGSLHDITERKQAEEEIRRLNETLDARVRERTAELTASLKELDAFSYSVSHDIRAPLRTIHAQASMALEDYGDTVEMALVDRLRRIQSNAARTGRLVDELLALSRMGRQSVVRAAVDMDRLVREVLRDAQEQNGAQDAEFVVSPMPSTVGNEVMLRQVWVNLISNALKFRRDGVLPRIEIAGAGAGQEVHYSVRDNGVGFDMRYADRLFRVFERLHDEAAFEGTGIGLALVRRIVERHGGRVWAEGEVGVGSVFWFALPAGAGELPRQPQAEAKQSGPNAASRANA